MSCVISKIGVALIIAFTAVSATGCTIVATPPAPPASAP
jgi:hypothetical protein